MAIVLYHVTLDRAKLDAMPRNERNFLVLLAHAANEIAILAKLFHYTAIGAPRKSLSKQVFNVQALLMGRLVMGKIYECWVILRDHYFGKALETKYEPQIEPECRTAIADMKKYFTGKNLISRIRNKYAFHYDLKQIAEGHRALEPGDSLDMYLSEKQANTLYAFADVIAGRAMLETIHRGDPKKALEMLIDETRTAIGWINPATGGLMAACFKDYFGEQLEDLNPKVIKVKSQPFGKGVRIPYFISPLREKPSRRNRRNKSK